MSLQPPVRNRVTCGTNSGYHIHRRNGQKACDDCRAAHTDYQRRTAVVKRSKKLIDNGVTVPAITFAELYLAAPVPLQDRIDRHLGTDLVDALIKAHDDYIDMVQKARSLS
ncbi:hypothetical protein F8M49_29945 [Rhodococcus zopfii]|uniref:Uncharacterized protein n=1 Tax=Rhodococcus zopfii TaxID=43772 RepID=A0ABU3WX72_9NOCA|nr:hypothetical protein [Rhodococcus zopfii]MDV2478585.1 hypothetical protein [Rhodococcus zopfii]